jgi:hypothetical protein
LQFTRNLFATDITYVLQKTSQLGGTWTNVLTYTAAAGWVQNNPGATVTEAGVSGSAPDEYVTVTVTAAPSGTRAFYRKLGYREVQIVRGYYQGIEDAVRLAKDLWNAPAPPL